ncbi:hypothetical protein IU486_31195 [Streptomyces gardneri]|uniref:papain-like cysteine protease family protein n=1 Tax=Nocardia abscessus TaxID=120957 RepID=UPI0018961F3B|nr:papain-like cysteine protease family protein [Nocardia abscessus]MBF6169169.1 hypothetical protein [Streptomyces gardneri]MBF6475253.1 hypothetical protein [Nocardia abscessus]
MNRIQALEKDLRRNSARLGQLTRRTRPDVPSKTSADLEPTAAGAPTMEAVASALSAWQGSRRTRRRASRDTQVRAMSVLDYRVPDLPMPIQQTSSMVCWAVVATMMASWRDRKTWTVDGYIRSLGEPWSQMLTNNQGLGAAEVPQLLATMGVQIETTRANFTSERWESMLREWGPIWVTADNNPALGVSGVHAHIMVGIHGPSDGDPTVDVIDPALGREVSMSMSQFVAKYEQLAPTTFAGLQIRHWPARAQQAAQQSLAWAHQALQRSRQQAVGEAIAVTGLLYAVVKDAATTHGLNWRKSELRGKTVPGNQESKKALADGNYERKSFKSLKRLVWDDIFFDDNVGAEFEVTYEYNGKCIANVRMTNTSFAPPSFLSGRELTVDTNITQSFAHERDDVCAVEVEIVYSFQEARGSAGTYKQVYVLFGDGRPEIFSESRA